MATKCKLREMSAAWAKSRNLEHGERVLAFRFQGYWYPTDEFHVLNGYIIPLSAWEGIRLVEIDVNGEWVIVEHLRS